MTTFDRIGPPVTNVQVTFPVLISTAYKVLSREPKYTMLPSATGLENTGALVLNLHLTCGKDVKSSVIEFPWPWVRAGNKKAPSIKYSFILNMIKASP